MYISVAIVATADEKEAFANIDVAILVGAMPRREGMERKDLLKANAKIFKTQGEALDKYAKKTCKIVVVGNPANTNCLIASRCAPSIPKENFTCLTRLDHNRAIAQVCSGCILILVDYKCIFYICAVHICEKTVFIILDILKCCRKPQAFHNMLGFLHLF